MPLTLESVLDREEEQQPIFDFVGQQSWFFIASLSIAFKRSYDKYQGQRDRERAASARPAHHTTAYSAALSSVTCLRLAISDPVFLRDIRQLSGPDPEDWLMIVARSAALEVVAALLAGERAGDGRPPITIRPAGGPLEPLQSAWNTHGLSWGGSLAVAGRVDVLELLYGAHPDLITSPLSHSECTKMAASVGQLSVVRWAVGRRRHCARIALNEAAGEAHTHVLDWLWREHRAALPGLEVALAAIAAGHACLLREVLECARADGSVESWRAGDWCASVPYSANCTSEILELLRSAGFGDWSVAALGHHLLLLGMPFDYDYRNRPPVIHPFPEFHTMRHSTRLALMRWLVDNGAPWQPLFAFAETGDVRCWRYSSLRWAVEHGAPWGGWTSRVCEGLVRLDEASRMSMGGRTMRDADDEARYGSPAGFSEYTAIVAFAHAHGCPCTCQLREGEGSTFSIGV